MQAIVFLAWLAMSFGLFMSPSSNLIMSAAPPGEHDTVSALMKTITNLGSAFGVCIFETVFALGMPKDAVHGGKSLMESHISIGQILAGLFDAYLCGAIICFLALFCMLLAKDAKASFVVPPCGRQSTSRR